MSADTAVQELPRVLNADGMLFLVGGSNNVLHLYRPDQYERACPLDAWRDRMAARRTFFADLGIPWRMLLAPEKLSVYGEDQLRARLSRYELPGDRFAQAMQCSQLLYPRQYLAAQTAHYTLYPKSDSHWNSLGAFCAFQVFAASIGLEIDPHRFTAMPAADIVYHGDLWTPQLTDIAPEPFRRTAIPPAMRVIYCNEMVGYKESSGLQNEPALHVGSHIIVHNPEAQFDRTLVLFGSSFSEYRLECSLLTFISAVFFSTVHFLWSADLDLDYIRRHRPDYVLIEMPERFTTLCPDDTMRIEAFGQARLAAFRQQAAR